eukprot:scaffold49176_cov81-Phaeocystis_antarctica.AAC.1
MIESGSCGGALVSTKSECEAAATALDLFEKTATDWTSYTSPYYPPGCQLSSSYGLEVLGGGSTGSCSSIQKCICMFTPPSPPAPPPSPPSPPSSPPMPPGYVQIAGGYYMIESGSCGSALISTKSECEAAATALDLSDKTADDYTSYTSRLPPGCQLYYSGPYRDLYVFGGGSTGSCSSDVQCICKSTPP